MKISRSRLAALTAGIAAPRPTISRALGPIQPVVWLSMAVRDGDDIQITPRTRVNQLVWESPQQDLPDTGSNLFADFRVLLEHGEGCPHRRLPST